MPLECIEVETVRDILMFLEATIIHRYRYRYRERERERESGDVYVCISAGFTLTLAPTGNGRLISAMGSETIVSLPMISADL